jgi:hypothetical protein
LKANSSHDEELPIPSQNALDRIEEVSETSANHGEMHEGALIRHNQSANPSAPFQNVRDSWDKEVPVPDVYGRPERVSSSSGTYSRERGIASEVAQLSVLGDEDAILGAQESDVHLSRVTSTISSFDSSLSYAERDTRIDKTEAGVSRGAADGEEEEDVALMAEKDGKDVLRVLTEQLTDMKRVLADEVAAALRHNTDQVATEVEKRVEAELRNRLAKSGFHPRMIDAVVNSGDGTGATEDRSYLSYTRVPYNQVEADTIRHYDLDFKLDVLDPNFWIIFERLRPGETEAMFEHTRRLRAEWSHRASRPRTPDTNPPRAVPTGAEVGCRSVIVVVAQLTPIGQGERRQPPCKARPWGLEYRRKAIIFPPARYQTCESRSPRATILSLGHDDRNRRPTTRCTNSYDTFG